MPRADLPSGDLDELTDAVLTASRLLIAVSARSIAAVNDTITVPQFRMLVMLDSRGPLKLTTLAEHLAVNPSTATRMADRLVTAELIGRKPNPLSRREVILELTPTGRRVVREVTNRRRAEIRKIVMRMPPAARRGLVDALSAFSTAGGEPPANGSVSDIAWL